jgi:hypothetical protein
MAIITTEKCEGGVEHTPYTFEEMTPEVVEALLAQNGVPAETCNACKVCGKFYPWESEEP